jgi:hypothetical protein
MIFDVIDEGNGILFVDGSELMTRLFVARSFTFSWFLAEL